MLKSISSKWESTQIELPRHGYYLSPGTDLQQREYQWCCTVKLSRHLLLSVLSLELTFERGIDKLKQREMARMTRHLEIIYKGNK